MSGQTSDSLKTKIEIFKDQLRESNPEYADLISEEEFLRLYHAFSEHSLNAIVGKPLPFFSLEDEHGTEMVSDIFKGKPTVILFWNSFCQPCLDLIPIIVDINNRYTDTVNVISITSDDVVDLSPYVDLHNFHIYHLFRSRSYNEQIGIHTLPKIIIIDKELVIQKIVSNRNFRNDLKSFDAIINKELTRLVKE